MKPEETVRRIVQRAMENNRLSQRSLAHAVGCGSSTIAKLLEEDTTRLTQEQWVILMNLGGVTF